MVRRRRMIAGFFIFAIGVIFSFCSIALSAGEAFQATGGLWIAILMLTCVSIFLSIKLVSLKRSFLKEKKICEDRKNSIPKEDTDRDDYISDLEKRLKDSERSLEEMKDRSVLLEKDLERSKKLESIGILAAGISHEINTPMQYITNNVNFFGDLLNDFVEGIVLYKELLLSCTSGEETDRAIERSKSIEEIIDISYLEKEIGEAIRHTNEGLDSVAKIVNAMKAFSHMGSEERVKTDLNEAIESAVTVSRNEWKYVAEMKMDFDADLPLVSCFASDIRQTVMNLIINAAHAIGDVIKKETGEKGLITVTTGYDKTSVFISVADTGTGIPEENLSKIFEPFFTTKEVGKGTGQGLAMAYNAVVKKHGGNLICNSEQGKGTEFIIELPIESIQSDKGMADHERKNVEHN